MNNIKGAIKHSYCRNNEKGNLLLLTIALGVLVILLGAFSLDLVATFFNRQILESRANALALEAATILNAGDRAGRLNHLIVGSRELIYSSRQKFYKTNQFPFDHLRPLAQQLLDQSRSGATLLEEERRRLIAVRLSQIKSLLTSGQQNSADKQDGKTGSLGQFVARANLGTFSDQTAEVSSSQVDPGLKDCDLKRQYIDKITGLYFGQIDVKLPDDDRDLSFKLCKLPSVAKGSALNNLVKYRQCAFLLQRGKDLRANFDEMPSAINLTLGANYKTMFSNRLYTLSATSTATTSGPAFR